MACVDEYYFDIVFIAVLEWELKGQVMRRFVVSNLLQAVACVVYIWKKIPVLRLTKEDLVATKRNIREHCRISFPMAFQASIIAIGTIMVQIALNQLGTDFGCGTQQHKKIDQLAILPMMSFGVTMATYSAQNFGAKKYDRIWLGVRECIKLSLTFAIVVGIILNLFSPILIRAFVGEDMRML